MYIFINIHISIFQTLRLVLLVFNYFMEFAIQELRGRGEQFETQRGHLEKNSGKDKASVLNAWCTSSQLTYPVSRVMVLGYTFLELCPLWI